MCWKAGDPWAFLNCQDSLLPFTRRKPTANRQHTVLIRVFILSTTAVKQSVYFNPRKINCDRLFKKFEIEMIVVDLINLSLLSFNADNEKKNK